MSMHCHALSFIVIHGHPLSSMVIHCHPLSSIVTKVVVFMPEGDRTRMGGTMRLGSRATLLRPGSRAFHLYGGEGVDALEVRNTETAESAVARRIQ